MYPMTMVDVFKYIMYAYKQMKLFSVFFFFIKSENTQMRSIRSAVFIVKKKKTQLGVLLASQNQLYLRV